MHTRHIEYEVCQVIQYFIFDVLQSCKTERESVGGQDIPQMQQERYMKDAIRQAKKAYAIGEVPIGCVIVYEDKIIARGYNRRNTDKNTLSHAEISAIRKASKKMGDWRLEGCTMYVTLEPCQMCAGALVQARIDRVVIGCMNPKAGCAGSVLNLLQMAEFNHQVEIERGVCGEECSALLRRFFAELRDRNRQEKARKAQLQAVHQDLSCGQTAEICPGQAADET